MCQVPLGPLAGSLRVGTMIAPISSRRRKSPGDARIFMRSSQTEKAHSRRAALAAARLAADVSLSPLVSEPPNDRWVSAAAYARVWRKFGFATDCFSALT